ncbi:exodeoxyribonuclease V subunit alpha [Aliidiomarina minuta]|uniref:RecBCD enzyme subunit RecD n=1 Tax=Aliidiomarina minuta TaxID=880057 RepID=A0A432W5U5_9GAMM|nr:exodeoxyribonuclease V subunit alpha [Aliidiomarina minuta]RUO25444.1 exodeoxyribonuclease V subunit alpha [Aliidiomarina minuta]
MSELMRLLQNWQQAGWIGQLDMAFAKFVQQESDASDLVTLAAALLSHQVGRGHVCMDLEGLLKAPEQVLGLPPEHYRGAGAEPDEPVTPSLLLASVDLDTWLQQLSESNVVCQHNAPLVIAGRYLYLRRYWQHEHFIAEDLSRRMENSDSSVSPQLLPLLNQLFQPVKQKSTATQDMMSQVNWQKLACANTLRSQFSVITGGPGTGKTYTVVRLLALLHKLHGANGTNPPRILLAAPTGKAAARLKSSILQALGELKDPQKNPQLQNWHPIFAQINAESSTLHRMLGSQSRQRAGSFRYNKDNPLPADVLVIDEASMVDIEMMSAVLQALPVHARLILLGDKDQLASVEAGAVLGQLCAGAEAGGYDENTFNYLQSISDETELPASLAASGPVTSRLQHVIMLRVSRRFADQSGIGKLAFAVNAGDSSAVASIINVAGQAPYQDIQVLAAENAESASVKTLCQEGFASYLKLLKAGPGENASEQENDEWARKVLNEYAQFQLLTPVREGEWGVRRLNELVKGWLPRQGASNEQWYAGRPVMITANDYSLNLRNGDIGILLHRHSDDTKRVVFIDGDNKVRWVLPSRLTHVETAYAMTVHKSQGSEFTHTVMVMPDRDNPTLSKELLYTGITRAKERLSLVLPKPALLINTVTKPTQRLGGLRFGGE